MLTEEKYLCMGCMSRLDENGKCRCGYEEDSLTDPACLPVRTVVGKRYLVGRMLSMNSESITYIGFDTKKEEKVFIYEFMPQEIAHRNDLTLEVVPKSGFDAQYKCLLTDFFDFFEALRNFHHDENMMPVLDVLSDNKTVYAVYKYVKTISYGEYLSRNGGEFTWPQVKKLFMPLFTTLTYLHSNGFIHRGISPESIRVNAKGQLLLSHFGTASLYTRGSVITPEFSSGYSAPETYVSSGWLGEWTDVYSVAAVLYKSLTGTLPPSADSRSEKDQLCPPENLEQNVPSNVSDAIMNAMILSVEYRTQSIDDFTAELLESVKSNTMLYAPPIHEELKTEEVEIVDVLQKKKSRPKEKDRKKSFRIPWGLVACFVVVVILIGIVSFLFRYTELLGLGNRPKKEETSASFHETPEDPNGTSEYTVTVPNFVGRQRNNVEGNEQYAQFDLVFVEESNLSYTEGMIFEQSVAYRTQVEEGETIVLKVSTGPEKVPMPQCVGMNFDEAVTLLSDMGIAYQAIPNFGTEYEYNVVYEQSVEAGEPVATGNTMTKVYIYYGAAESGGSVHVVSDDDDDDHRIILGGK